MKKYFLKTTNEEVKPGDVIAKPIRVHSIFGELNGYEKFHVTEDNLEFLVEKGILVCKEDKKEDNEKMFEFYLDRYCKRLQIDRKTFDSVFTSICKVNPMPLFSALCKEVAVAMSRKYKEPISKWPDIYFISPVDGCIHPTYPHLLEKEGVTTKYTSFFRTAEDAEEALNILAPLHCVMFPYLYGKQEDKKQHSKGV